MKLETRRAALRAAQAVAGLSVIACSPAAPDVPNKTLAPASSCPAAVEKFFPGDDDPYEPNKHVSAPREVERCCNSAFASELSKEDSAKIYAHWRWRCCTVIDQSTNDPRVGYACTPWGPPVPPPMRRRAALV